MMADSRPVYTSKTEGYRDAKEIDRLRVIPEPKPRAPRRGRREPMDRSLTYFCSNPQCDHTTWAPQDQARHMASEFWWAVQVITRLLPDSPESLKLTGGIVLSELTDDECRAANAERMYLKRRGEQVPLVVHLTAMEYGRRQDAGILTLAPPKAPGTPRRPRKPRETCRNGHRYTPENTGINSKGSRECKKCRRQTEERNRKAKNARDRDRRAREKAEREAANVR